ncbi:MAG: hypothetical protein WDO16_23215 [Bacteroidota bacterium]
MKSYRIAISVLGITAAFLLFLSCTKQTGKEVALEKYDLDNYARLQVYNVAVGNQRNYVYIDGKPVTGAALLYTNATFTPLFPATPNSFIVTPGIRSFSIRDTLGTSTQPQLAFAENLAANSYYTIFAYDTMSAIKQKTVLTTIVTPSDSTARVRFGNFVFFKTGVPPNVDIFSKRRNANVFTNIAVTEVTDFIPYESGTADSLIVRSTGTTTALDTAVFNFTRKRSYTLVFRGRYAVNEAGTNTFPRTLSSFNNY